MASDSVESALHFDIVWKTCGSGILVLFGDIVACNGMVLLDLEIDHAKGVGVLRSNNVEDFHAGAEIAVHSNTLHEIDEMGANEHVTAIGKFIGELDD
jgi:predicted RecA/RadA family phage recombinase